MNQMKRLLLPMLALFVGCGGPREEASIDISAATVAATATPSTNVAMKPVFIETGTPYSRCTLSGGSDDPLPVVTDHNGVITLHVGAADTAAAPNVTYSCTDASGKVFTGTSASSRTVAAQQRLRALHDTLPADARVLPALQGDPSTIPQATLIKGGYPPRPDVSAGNAYTEWVKNVSRPITFVPPHPIEIPGLHGSSSYASSQIWSGIVVPSTPGITEVSAFGYWNVPNVAPSNGIYWSLTKTDILQSGPLLAWTGMGGWTPNINTSLVQSGTETATGRYQDWLGVWRFYVTAYAWMEWYPGPLTTLPSLIVNPGESMQVHTWVGDAAGNLTAAGQYAWAYIINNTRGTATWGSVPVPSGYVFDGSTVEWILESNIEQGNYNRFVMSSTAFAQAADYSIHQWQTEPFYWLVYMTSIDQSRVRTTTSVGDTLDPYSLHFFWVSK